MTVHLKFGVHTSFGFGMDFCWPSSNAPMAYGSASTSLLPPIFTGPGGIGLDTFCVYLTSKATFRLLVGSTALSLGLGEDMLASASATTRSSFAKLPSAFSSSKKLSANSNVSAAVVTSLSRVGDSHS